MRGFWGYFWARGMRKQGGGFFERVGPKDRLECRWHLATLKIGTGRSKLIGDFIDSYLKLTAEEDRDACVLGDALAAGDRIALRRACLPPFYYANITA